MSTPVPDLRRAEVREAPVVTPLAGCNSTSHRAADADEFVPRGAKRVPLSEPILEPLIVPLAMIVIDQFCERPPKVSSPKAPSSS
jgi:hypothetical protein